MNADKKTSVVHIITKLELGGAQEHVLHIYRNLDRKRFSTCLITGDEGPLVETAVAIPDGKVYFVKELVREVRPVNDVLALVRIFLILRRLRPDIVHTNSSKAGIVGRWAAFFAGVPVIIHTVHGFGFNNDQKTLKRGLFVWLERITSPITTFFIAVAQDNINKAVAENIFASERAEVIRSGINTGFFAEPPSDMTAVRSCLGVPVDAPLVSMVSCLKPQKAPVDFVRVAARVVEQIPEAHFVQAGDGELRDEVLAEAVRLGVADRFHLLGWRNDVREIIHSSDLLVLTSLWEGLPRVLPQAMAAGKPIVATAVDGTPEAVHDGVNGYLSAAHDINLMADRVVALLRYKELAARMGDAGRAMADEFDEGTMLRRTVALYDRLLQKL